MTKLYNYAIIYYLIAGFVAQTLLVLIFWDLGTEETQDDDAPDLVVVDFDE
jgi:hypothetical protein